MTVDENKLGLTKLHLYLLFLGGALLALSSMFEQGDINFLLGLMGGTIFFIALLTERYTKKFQKQKEKAPKEQGFLGAILGGLIGGVFSGVINLYYMLFSNGLIDEKGTVMMIISIVGTIIIGAVIGFLLNYIKIKQGFEPISPPTSDSR